MHSEKILQKSFYMAIGSTLLLLCLLEWPIANEDFRRRVIDLLYLLIIVNILFIFVSSCIITYIAAKTKFFDKTPAEQIQHGNQQPAKELVKKDELLELIADAIIVRDLTGRIIYWNGSAGQIFKWTKEEALGQDIGRLLTVRFEQPLRQVYQELFAADRWSGESTATLRDGAIITVKSDWYLKRDTNGNPQVIMEINRDITQDKILDRELQRIARIELVGQMAAAIGHEIRNPLTTVRGFLQLLTRDAHSDKHKEYHNLMIREVDKANAIITEYLSLAKDKILQSSLRNLKDIISSFQPLIQSDSLIMTKKISVVYNLHDSPNLLIDENEIRQMIIHLIKNALEAAPPFSIVTVSTYQQETSAVLAIKDEGNGIPDEIIAKIGTPFITTKDLQAGLGLAVCYSIAARHKAKIDISTGSNGTTICICFPIPEDEGVRILLKSGDFNG